MMPYWIRCVEYVELADFLETSAERGWRLHSVLPYFTAAGPSATRARVILERQT